MSSPDPSRDLSAAQEPVFDEALSQLAVADQRVPALDRVMDLMPGFVYVFNNVTYSNDYSNRSIGEQMGYSPQEIRDMGDQMLTRIVHPDDHVRLLAHMARIAQLDDDSSISFDYRVITKSGEERWLRSVDAVYDRASDGSVLRHIGCATDVTVEKEGELRLAQMNAQLEAKVAERTHDLAALNDALESRITERTFELQEAVDELEQLTYIATHDLKVPVNNLCRLGLMLGDSKHMLQADQAEQVGWINECASQLSAKIQGLVLVAQIRLSSALPAEPLNLRASIDHVMEEFSRTMGHAAHPVVIEVDQGLMVDFARFELNSILASVMDNAIKYAEASRPLEITFQAEERGGQVSLYVRDNGSGIDGKRDKDKVFGLFQRAHKAPAGSGISLYCARRMLHRRGGDMTVDGVRGEGAVFHLKFPKREGTGHDG